MALKLYYGGFGEYKEFVVADSEEQAILKVGIKLNAPFLPVTVEEISVVDGYQIQPISAEVKIPVSETQTSEETISETPEEVEITNEPKIFKCKKCDFIALSPIELAQHSRKEHPKGD